MEELIKDMEITIQGIHDEVKEMNVIEDNKVEVKYKNGKSRIINVGELIFYHIVEEIAKDYGRNY